MKKWKEKAGRENIALATRIMKEYGCIDMFFFFQAEDGIRDLTVTGVQTCALPISVSGIAIISHRRSIRDYNDVQAFNLLRLHRDRTPGRHCHHRHPRGAVIAGLEDRKSVV